MALPHRSVNRPTPAWSGWQSVSDSFGVQCATEQQRREEMDDDLVEPGGAERGLVNVSIYDGVLVKVVAEFWMQNDSGSTRLHRVVRWFLRGSTAEDWVEGIATRWERSYGE